MRHDPSRRELLGAGAAAAGVAGCGRLLWDSTLLVPPELADLVVALEEARSRRDAVEVAGEHLATGGSGEDLDRALLVACCRQLDFSELGFAAHPLWTVWPAREVGRRGSAPEAVVAALHAVDLFKREHRASRGKRQQPGEVRRLPAPDPLILEAAIADRDADAADAAALALYQVGDLSGIALGLCRGALRDVGWIGHPAVSVAQTVRAMDEVGWEEAMVRTLAWSLAHGARSEEAVRGPWEASAALAEALPTSWDRGVDDPAGALALLPRLRTKDAGAAAQAVADALAGGLGLASAWDALAVRASEIALAHRDLDGVFAGFHCVTGLEAMRWIEDTTVDDATRRIAVLQGAALLAVNDREARDRSGDEDPVRLDELEPMAGSSARAVLDAAVDDRLGAARRVLGLADLGSLIEAQRVLAVRAVVEEHQLKLPVAGWVAAERAHPQLAPLVLAGTLSWGSTPEDRDWDLLELAVELAAEAT